jgi:WD40 repeat protein
LHKRRRLSANRLRRTPGACPLRRWCVAPRRRSRRYSIAHARRSSRRPGRIEEIPFSPKRISVGDDLVGDLLVKAGPKLWDLDTGEVLRTLEGHQASVTAVALLDEHRALSASHDKPSLSSFRGAGCTKIYREKVTG